MNRSSASSKWRASQAIHTSDSYAYAFRLLLDYASKRLKVVPSRIALERIDASLVTDFLNSLEIMRKNRPGSRNVRLAAIKSFMHFMEFRVPAALDQIRRILAIPMKRTDTRLVRHLSAKEVQALLDAPNPVDWAGIRDRAMLHLCFAAGLRVSELTGIQLKDLSLHPEASILVHGKGRKECCLHLWKQTAVTLRAWLAVREKVLVPELFLNARRMAMARSGFEYILRKHVRVAGAQKSGQLRLPGHPIVEQGDGAGTGSLGVHIPPRNALLLGNSGTGKTHIALALGLAACQKGYRVRFTTAAAMVHELIEAKDEKRLLRYQKQMAVYELLILDELGFVPLSKTGAELLFEVFSQRYERASTMIENSEGSTNVVFLCLRGDLRFVGGKVSAPVRVVTEFSTV